LFGEAVMKRQIVIGLSILLAGASFASADKLPYKRGELIVRFADTGAGSPVRKAVAGPLSNRAVKGVISNLAVPGARVANEYEGITPGLAVVSLPEGATVADALGQFNGSPGVLYAQPNYIYKLAAIPNDLYFSLLWNMEQIKAPEAWDIQTSGIGAIVAVMDTGVDYSQSPSEVEGHEDLFVFDDLWINDGEDMLLTGELDTNDVNTFDDDDNGLEDDLIGADFGGPEFADEGDPDGNPENIPDDTHGTHVAGIIGAIGNNGIGVAGVCWQSRIMHLKIFANDYTEETGASTIDIVRAIDYAIEHGARIINASWGAYEIELDQLLYDRISDANDAGILFVAAAGNGDDEFGFPVNTDWMPFYPASYDLDNIISVMATDADDNWASSYSNYGPSTVDLAAPGGDEFTGVYSTVLDDEYDDEYDDDVMFGTSMAAPHVSGAAALMWTLDYTLTCDEVKRLLLYSVDKLPSLQGLCVSGGRLNLYRALKMAKGGRVRNTRGTPDPTDDTFKSTIHAAMLSASDGDELIADRDSWYIEDVDFGSKQIILRSGDIDNPSDQTVYPHNTYISGAFDPGSNVVTFTGAGPGAVLKGFTILHGSRSGIYCDNASPIIEDCIITENTSFQGSGIYCTNGSAPTIIDCDITGNTAWDSGGGIYCTGGSAPGIIDCNIIYNTAWDSGGGIYCSNSDADIIDCTIRNNNAGSNDGGGIYCDSGSNADITNTTISNNTADKRGGGIYVSSSSPTINGCEVAGNSTNASGGGIYCRNSSGADIINTTVSNNTTKYWGGGIYCYNSSGPIKNCLIINNAVISWDGGGIYLEKSSPAIANCTIAGNAANENNGVGGGLCCFDSSDPDITDCIFSGNQRYAVANYYYDLLQISEPHLRYCLFYNNSEGDYVIYDDTSPPPVLDVCTGAAELNGIAGNGYNIDDDPIFVRGRLGNYYLSQGPAGQILFDPNTVAVLGDANSPAVDVGSDTAAAVGMSIYSTRTDTVKDGGIVDIGYHYDDPESMQYYDLTAVVTPSDSGSTLIPSSTTSHKQYAVVLLEAAAYDDYQFKSWYGTDDDTVMQLDDGIPGERMPWPRGVQYNVVTMNGHKTVTAQFETVLVQLFTSVSGEDGTISPSTHRPRYYRRGGVVDLYATPSDSSHAIIWTGTDDDYSILRYNTVTMVAPFTEGPDGGDAKEVNVEFYEVQALYFPGDHPTLQAAIDAAHERDIIIIAEANEPYINSWGYEVLGKAITITSARPDDPCCVAKTVFEMETGEQGNVGNAFRFQSVGRNTILNGVTLRGWSHGGIDGEDGSDMDDFNDGEPGYDDFGGAISCWGASPTIKNCVIADCNISGGDGGDGQVGNEDHPDGFNGGFPGRAYGGGMACLSGGVFMPSSPLVINCTFDNCSAAGGVGGDGGNGNSDPDGWGGKGGGYYYPWWEVYTPWEFEGLYRYDDDYSDPARYSGRGGAVYVGEYCSPRFIGCTFNSNYSQGGSNGICGQNEPTGSRNQPSIHWLIDNMGGAVYCGIDSEAEFIDCVFTDNYADVNLNLPEDEDYNNNDSFVGFGGAVGFDKGAKVTFENCIFYDNYASVGGAIYGNNSDPIIADCTVTDNNALHGGGMLFVGGTTKIARSTFNLNLANESGGQGGAICCLGANAEITDCNIVNNEAAESGGGIYISSEDIDGGSTGDGALFIRNCLITQNSAFRDGGGISTNWHSDPNIVNCTIKDNTVTSSGGWGGGLFCSYGNYTNVLNSILWGNYAGSGAQIAVATSSEYDPRPSTVKVSYSDVQDGAAGVFLDDSPGANCELIWDYSTNLTGGGSSNPKFVSGYLGDYFLSQPDTGDPNQTALSPCVDAGDSGDEYWDAYWFGMYRHTTRTDGVPDTGRVDMGYHYVLAADIIGDYNFDGVVDFNDYKMFLWHWLEKDCDFPDWCFGADLNKDGIVNFKDDAIFKLNYGQVDTTPPIPDPMTWAVAPLSAGETSITMRATEAFDNSGYPVLYYFQRTDANGVPDPNFGQWGWGATYTDSGLAVDTEYGYKVRATDYKHKDPNDPNYPLEPNDPGAPFDVNNPNDPNIGNKTGWSVIGYAITGEGGVLDDTDPPTPDPMTWADPAYTATMSSITLFATTASDVSGVEYYFEDYDSPGYNSGWINDPTWIDTGLAPLTTYSYRVRARDTSINQNMTGWSSVLSATTLAEGEDPNEPPPPDDQPPLPNPSEWFVPPYMYETGGTRYHYMDANEASDAATGGNDPVWYYFDCINGTGIDSGWQESTIYEYPHNSNCVYVVRTTDSIPGSDPPQPNPANVGLDSDPAYTGD